MAVALPSRRALALRPLLARRQPPMAACRHAWSYAPRSSPHRLLRRCTSASPATSAIEPVGLGISSAPLTGVGARQLFKAMLFGIDGADRFLPVTSVSVRPAHGAAAEEGAVLRAMTLDDGTKVVEHVYADRLEGLIRFVQLEGAREGELEVVHVMHSSPLRLEYYQRHRLTGERVFWDAPRRVMTEAIDATVALARAAESHAAATDDFGGKA
ncbi:hypothetical protein AB1Y20_002339 [Prymnesium parvum]|uniref:Uncharacterized protein n=1 Tax=Prymnesium parvum TaxID=97485 RepID=A0AB34J7Q5_PRYPA